MAFSIDQYTGDGVNRNFAVSFPYLARAHVAVFVNGVQSAFTWVNPSLIQLASAPASGVVVRVQRLTPREQILVDFSDGSILTESDLDTATLQTFFLMQETLDAVGSTIAVAEDGTFDAQGLRISNVAAPTQPGDAVTRQWAETATSAQLAQAITARQGAETARTGAETARSGSETARDASIAARDAANAARDSASGHRLNAQNAQTAAEAARDVAITNRNEAQGFRNQAESEKNGAISARQGAETARDQTFGARDETFNARDAAQNSAQAAAQSASILANAGTAILRNITVSTSAPSGSANDGDLWLQVT